jgi:hypothetical protein
MTSISILLDDDILLVTNAEMKSTFVLQAILKVNIAEIHIPRYKTKCPHQQDTYSVAPKHIIPSFVSCRQLLATTLKGIPGY